MPAAPLYPSRGEVELPGLSLARGAGGKGVPIGRGEGKWFVWQGLRVVGKVAGTCERVFGGGGGRREGPEVQGERFHLKDGARPCPGRGSGPLRQVDGCKGWCQQSPWP